MAVRDDRRGKHKDHKLYDGKITHKEFGEDDNEGHDAAQWKNRAKDWYNAERRFIFATCEIPAIRLAFVVHCFSSWLSDCH